MSEEVQIELPQPLALIVEDLSSLYEFAPMEHSKIDPKYYELQGKTDGILWYVDLKEGNSRVLAMSTVRLLKTWTNWHNANPTLSSRRTAKPPCV